MKLIKPYFEKRYEDDGFIVPEKPEILVEHQVLDVKFEVASEMETTVVL